MTTPNHNLHYLMKLYKSTIVIWSEYDPTKLELSHLARDAESGDAYCAKCHAEVVDAVENDPDWDGTDFFGDDSEEDYSSANNEINDPKEVLGFAVDVFGFELDNDEP